MFWARGQGSLAIIFVCLSALVSLRSYNPANWMLEATSPDAEAATGMDFAERFTHSEQAE
jgi:hypothetical protein